MATVIEVGCRTGAICKREIRRCSELEVREAWQQLKNRGALIQGILLNRFVFQRERLRRDPRT